MNRMLSSWLRAVVGSLAVVTAVGALGAASARAQDYPTRSIRILVPYAPGGIADIAARIVGAKLSEAWGQQAVVENRPGGNGFIAMELTARSNPDGYTLVVATVGDVAINPALFKEMPYNVERDFAPIASLSDAPVVLAAHGASPYKTVKDVIAAAKAQPATLNVGTPGFGSINQLILESFALNTGTKFVHVPYKGGAPAAQALVAGDIPLAILASSTVAPHVPSGNIRVLAVTSASRSPLNPEWPTLQDEGGGDVNASNWTLLLAPKATPQPVLDKLNAAVVKILNAPDVKQRFAGGGVATIPSSSAELDGRIKREAAVYKVIVEKANVHVD
jgi:tripartite-type tricarboxylate transporter receptor subunit TctC